MKLTKTRAYQWECETPSGNLEFRAEFVENPSGSKSGSVSVLCGGDESKILFASGATKAWDLGEGLMKFLSMLAECEEV